MRTEPQREAGRLIIVCGLPGSGKTTHAKQLEERLHAIRFSPDEWMEALEINLYDSGTRERVEALQWTFAQNLLRLGQTVIIEWGTWGRSERDTLRIGARALGAAVELHFLDAPVNVLYERIRLRNMEFPPIQLDDLVKWNEAFERPTRDELALFDTQPEQDVPTGVAFRHPQQETHSMALQCINPEDLPIPEMYSQVVVATGSKLVFVSGQQPEDIHGKLVGRGDFAAQARLAFGNLGRALAAAGARPEQVCKITIYVVDYKRDEHVPIIEAAQIALFGDHKPANVVVGIATMSPGYLIEVDAIAVIDHTTESYGRAR